MKHEVINHFLALSAVRNNDKERAIRRSLKRVLSLVECAKVHKAHLNIEGVYDGWDITSQRMFGYRGEDVVGRMHLSEMFACPEDFQHVWRIVRAHRRFVGDIAFRCNDERIIIVRLIIQKDFSEQGDFRGYTISALDRSDERKLEVELENHLVMLAETR